MLAQLQTSEALNENLEDPATRRMNEQRPTIPNVEGAMPTFV